MSDLGHGGPCEDSSILLNLPRAKERPSVNVFSKIPKTCV